MEGDRVGPRVVGVDGRHGGVVGVHEPRQRPAVDVLDRPADRSGAGQVDVLEVGAVGGAMKRHAGDAMRGAHDEQQVLVEVVAVEQGHGFEDCLRVLGDEVVPGARRPGPRGRDRQPAARCIEVGTDVDAPVTPERQGRLRIDVALHEREGGARVRARREVGHPQVVARLGALAARHLQPVPVSADLDAVVVRHRHPGAEHEDVRLGRRPDAVEVDAPVEVALRLGQQVGRDAADVVERVGAGHPRDGGVSAAVDRSLEGLAGGHVHHVQQRLLVSADRQLVGQSVSLLGRLPGVEGGQSRGVEGHGVDERTLGAVGLDDVEDGELLAGLAPGQEVPGPPPVGG